MAGCAAAGQLSAAWQAGGDAREQGTARGTRALMIAADPATSSCRAVRARAARDGDRIINPAGKPRPGIRCRTPGKYLPVLPAS